MINQVIKNMILNYELSEEMIEEYLDFDYRKTIIGILNALYELLLNYDNNKILVNNLLDLLETLVEDEKDIDNIIIFYEELKKVNNNIYKELKPDVNLNLQMVVKKLQSVSKSLKQTIVWVEAEKKIKLLENIIEDKNNLKIISTLIRENKNILKIVDSNNENILFKLLKKYNDMDKDSSDLNYFYQVISLFINSDYLHNEIIKNIDYYMKALSDCDKDYVREIKKQLEVQVKSIVLEELEKRYQIYTTYSSEIESELNTFEMGSLNDIDLTNFCSFTIDGEGSMCLDDSIYLKKLKDGSYLLFVNITRIPALIPYDSEINRESIRRMETYYLVDAVYSLYPEYVSYYLASLLPNNIRYTQTGIWRLEPDLTLVEDSFKLLKSTTMSRYKLTYEKADEIIGSNLDNELSQTLKTLGIFALKQRNKNKTKEKYREFENDKSCNPNHESKFVNKYIAANIVQECALLFNHSKGMLYKDKGLPYIFRACGEGKSLSLDKELLNINDFSLEKMELVSGVKAFYTAEPLKHWGLGYEAYCHGGSPGRRSPDAQNQYIDEDLIFSNNLCDKTVYRWENQTKRLVSHYNEASSRIEAFANQYNYLTNKKLLKK